MVRVVSVCLLFAFGCVAIAQGADVADQVAKIRELVQENKADEAEAAFQEALKESPDAPELSPLRPLLFSALMRAGQVEPAAKHATIYHKKQLQQFRDGKLPPGALSQSVNMASQALLRANQLDKATEVLTESVDAVDERAKTDDAEALGSIQGDLRLSLVQMRYRTGKLDDAKHLLATELKASQAGFEAKPENADWAARLARVMEVEVSIAQATGGEGVAERRQAYRKFVREQAEKHPGNQILLSSYLSGQSQAIRELAQTQPDEADKLIAEHREFLTALAKKEGAQKGLLDNALRGTAALEQMVAAERKRLVLIGKPALPLDVEAWANGEPIAEGELAGKVVLLDFWAVWCGPCIATFPHLREWKEKYGPQGFEILGMTRYYEYGWDADTNRPKRVADLSPEDERAAMADFAAHHKLTHRFAITPKASTFQQEYGVTGIPQAVLIDRKGIIRMIRVGSGDKNAHDLDEMIQTLLKE
ncbi:MAG: TlpA disulfide reductase family protein [Planctomycetota bacterium]|nr:TlpA disulfide reductase family protein [Planctomycetota bacterium]